MKAAILFERYPQLNNLRRLVPDSLIEKEIGSRAEKFEAYLSEAKKRIPTVNLNKIFPPELEKGTITLEKFLGQWGNVSIEELCKICLIVKWLKPSRILEMGTYNGMTTLQMALNAPRNAVVHTIDLPPDHVPTLRLDPLDELLARHFDGEMRMPTGAYFAGRSDIVIVQILSDTATFDYSGLERPIDLVFVDAAHDLANATRDTENAFDVLSEKGVILWHNYADVIYPDVTSYLGKVANTHPIFHLRNTNLAVYFAGYRPR